jgi:hypothetical protein
MINTLQHHENQQTTQLNTKSKTKKNKKPMMQKNTRSKITIMLKQHKENKKTITIMLQ